MTQIDTGVIMATVVKNTMNITREQLAIFLLKENKKYKETYSYNETKRNEICKMHNEDRGSGKSNTHRT